MSERPTPETDAAIYPMNQVDIVWPEFARKLERERDDAREECKFLWDERDQARGELAALKASIFKSQGITMPRGSTTGWINCGAIGGSK